jgi:hypothetical protein
VRSHRTACPAPRVALAVAPQARAASRARSGLAAALALVTSAAALALPATARAADPQQPSFPPPEEDTGIPRPPPPDDRTGHIYVAPSFGVIGGVGSFGPNLPTSTLAGLGYNVGAIVGMGIGRYATIQIFGDRAAFGAPANCNVGGCTGTSYALGLGFTYHLTQALAFDPWGSFGMAYRTTLFTVSQGSTAMVDGQRCVAGQLCPESFRGLDAARIAFGGDFYPTPWFGFGPFVEVDIGTALHRPVSDPPVGLPPNVTDGPRTYGFFQFGVRVAFDPMRSSYKKAPAATATESGHVGL